jgi:hypothetical protein
MAIQIEIPVCKTDQKYNSGLCAQIRASSLAGGMPVW